MSKPYNILTTCDFFYPHQNGVMVYIMNLYRPLIERGLVTVTAVCFNTERVVDEEFYEAFRIIRLPAKPILGGTYNLPGLKAWRRFKVLLQTEQFDLVNTHTRFFLTSLMVTKLTKSFKIPHIHIEHGAMFVPHSNPLVRLAARIYDECLGRYVIKSADLVAPLSAKGREFVARLGAHKRIEILPNGVNLPVVTDRQIPNMFASPIDSSTLTIAFVGRLVKEKGVQDLLMALKIAKRDFRLLVIGDGPYGVELKGVAEQLSLSSYIQFLGVKSHSEIFNTFSTVDLVVNPSYAEGMPTTVLEAAICNCQVIATDVGGTADICGESPEAALFSPGDIDTLTGLLAKAPKRSNDETSLSKHVQQHFLWPDISDRFFKMVQSLLEN